MTTICTARHQRFSEQMWQKVQMRQKTAAGDSFCLLPQHAFWGWGKEDNNMVRRLQLHHMWPPERPRVRQRLQQVGSDIGMAATEFVRCSGSTGPLEHLR